MTHDDVRLVEAARDGDRDALAEIVRACLPAVHALARRSLPRAEADDVIQEVLLRVVKRLGTLRQPERFRSWVLTIAVHEIRRAAAHRRLEFDARTDLEVTEVADDVDLEERTLARMALSEQRRELSLASRWLDPDDRELLGLWWLELAGELDRDALADAAGLSPSNLRVRLHRLRERLDAARAVVRVLDLRVATYRCADLDSTLTGWTGDLSSVWRKRLVRHVTTCARCDAATRGLVATDRLLAGVPVLAAPLAFHHVPALVVDAAGGPATTGWSKAVAAVKAAVAKPVAVVVTGLVVVGAGTVAYAGSGREASVAPTQKAAALPRTSASASALIPPTSATPPPTPSVSAAPRSGLTYRPAPGTGTGRTYYISPTGDDRGAGTADRPWRTVNRATSSGALRPGDTVRVAKGLYVERVRLRGSGSSTRGHITLRGDAGAVIRDPQPNGENWIPGSTVIAQNVSHWLIEGLRVENAGWAGIALAGTHHMIVANNRVVGSGASCIIALPADHFTGGEAEVQSSDLTVMSNTLQKCNRRYPGGGTDLGAQEALSVWGVDRFEVAGNRVLGCTREGIDAKTGSRHGRIHHNTVTGCASVSGTPAGYNGGPALYLDGNRADMFDIEVDHNLVYRNVADGITVADEDADHGDVRRIRIHDNVVHTNGRQGVNGGAGVTVAGNTTGVVVEHNTLYANVQAFWLGQGTYAPGYQPRDVVFRNNIAAASTWRNGVLRPAARVTLTDNVITTGVVTAYDVDAIPAAAVTVTGTKRLRDPQFVDPPGTLSLRPGSPASGTGVRGAAGAPAGNAVAAP